MPAVSEYEGMVGNCAEFDKVSIWEENADRLFSRDELVRWIDQPSLVPFLKQIRDSTRSTAFRKRWWRQCYTLQSTRIMIISKPFDD